MSSFLVIRFRLMDELQSREIEALFRYCFDDLEGTRSPPDSDKTNQFSYSTEGTGWDSVVGDSIDNAVDEVVRTARGTIWFWYDDLNVGVHVNLKTRGPDIPSITLSINSWYVKPWRNDQPELIHEFVLELYDYLSPLYVYGENYLDESSLSREGITSGQLEDLFWVNGFGPEMAASIGRERLLNAPAWRVDECDDGGVFLWQSPLPLSMSRNDYIDALTEYFALE